MSNLLNQSLLLNNSSCPVAFDYFCWPQTPINQSVTMSCASFLHNGIDTSKSIVRHCLSSGAWSNSTFQNVEPCFYPDVWALFNKSVIKRSPVGQKLFHKLVKIFIYCEIGGFSISLISIFISLIIFFSFKSLYCERTKIHVHLLLAILIQIIARLTVYVFQMVPAKDTRKVDCFSYGNIDSSSRSLYYKVCALPTIFLQFGITAMFMWMLCEGINLNNILTVGVFKNRFKPYYFHIIGWVVPFCLTFSWSIVMFIKEPRRRCFYNCNLLPYYWIIDGPRYTVIIINFIFLLNIIRILMVKIREDSEKQVREEKRRGSLNAKFVRKAVKTAIFLLPLLGINHVLETFVSVGIETKPITTFAIYYCVNIILKSLQGFYCALLYCFLHSDVRVAIKRRFRTTQIWYRWKKYLGDKDPYQNGTVTKPIRSNIDLKQLNFKLPENDETIKSEEYPLTSTIDEIH